MKNVLILTSGLSGSSVLSNLISQAGYWVGDETLKKEYDTHENSALVELNEQLIERAGYPGKYTQFYDSDAVARIGKMASDDDQSEYQNFIKYCNQHSPWVWKDPRLWVTFDYWAPLLDKEQIKVVFLDRGQMQRWISVNLRRQVQSYDYCRSYTKSVNSAIKRVINEYQLDHLDINFDDLLLQPQNVIDRLNTFLGSELTLEDLKRVYNKPLYKKARGFPDFVTASLVYLKNYRERID